MDNHHTFPASRVYNNNHINDSSSYRVPPSTGYPVQPVRPPMIPPQQAVYRENATALTYTRNQMVHNIWMRDPQTGKAVVRPAKGLSCPGSYTDLTTGQRYTYQQMIEITGKILAEHFSRTKPQVDQAQLFQAVQVQQRFQPQMQSQVHPHHVGHPLCEYTDGRAYQSQSRPEVQNQRFAEQQAHMTQQGQGQQSLLQQGIHPSTQPLSHVAKAGNPTFIDKLGRQWSRQQYEELVRRQEAQKAQASTTRGSGLGSQLQQASQTPSLMTMSLNDSLHMNDMHNGMAPQTHPDLLQHQKGNMGPPPGPANPGVQQQHQYMPPGTKSLQQSPIADQSGRQWTRSEWEKVERCRESKKNLVPPSHATKASVPGNPSRKPVAHKQSMSKIQKQPVSQPAASVAQSKKPSVTQPAKQAVPCEVKVTGKEVANESLNSLATSTSVAPVPQSNQPTQISMSKQPSIALNTTPTPNPPPVVNQPPVSTQPITVSQWDVENGRMIHDSITSFISSHQEAHHEAISKVAAPTPTLNPRITSPSSTTNSPPTTATAPSLPSPSILSIFTTVKHHHHSTGLSDFSELNGGVLAKVDNLELLRTICTVDPDGSFRAPEPRWVSEERARLEWEVCVVGRRYR
ncbi:hypothetical protein COCMIDRAFT_104425 [Bipolaris oryzae ATCC 44560]|uniref:Uncharacterized protein n=1 Tax=Bipolaris oryzae ATCC 44560 TaxID=930090 RepID=W6YRL5_COCMI|nr:uncharacterized protein COCMIDRAFT_104425 [Bipolaris oryzae ATCC 44560]EUC42087.1 hypothetical protein COCMIDRAFT_104425 [Bipolaris oryzae ATCC 44560]